jgi:phage baseplate assembly protein W
VTDVPHFSLPLRFGPQAAVAEQDSIDEIADAALAVILCPVGYRVELPEFGLPDVVFSSPVVDTDDIRTAIEAWEPRAQVALDQHPDALDALVSRVTLRVLDVRTGD